jgi:hypothetical protein
MPIPYLFFEPDTDKAENRHRAVDFTYLEVDIY